jgi:hypothetical protein
MANANKVPSTVLPLPPLDYDVQYLNNLVRLLNYYIVQHDNPGSIRCSTVEVSNGSADVSVVMDALASNSGTTRIVFREIPTSATGLEQGQVWNDSGTLKIVL